MMRAAKPGGRVVVLDYNHEDNSWDPDPPAAFRRFYRAFLEWRRANQWDNRMADHLPDLFRAAGITGVRVHLDDQSVHCGDLDFFDRMRRPDDGRGGVFGGRRAAGGGRLLSGLGPERPAKADAVIENSRGESGVW
jgi:hypothetical protein